MALTEKQSRFVEAYVGKAKFNKTKAALLAGYSEKTAYNIGWENVRKREISEAIALRLKESAMSADEVLMHLGKIARNDVAPDYFIRGDGTINKTRTKEYGFLIKAISYTVKGTVSKIEMYDSMKAKELMAKHFGLLTDKIEHSWQDRLPDNTNEVEVKKQFQEMLNQAREKSEVE